MALPPISSPGGEIGRHATLRGWCRLRHASSTLVLGTSPKAPMAELVDAYVSGAYIERCAGSTPVRGTQFSLNSLKIRVEAFSLPHRCPTKQFYPSLKTACQWIDRRLSTFIFRLERHGKSTTFFHTHLRTKSCSSLTCYY